MATYNARTDELQELAQNRLIDPGVSSQDTVSALGETDAMRAAIERYATVRNAHLNQLLRAMDESEAEKNWNDAVSDARSSMHSTLGDALHNVRTPNIAALHMVMMGTNLEDQFYDALAKTSIVGAAADWIDVYRKEVTNESEALSDLWAEQGRVAQTIGIDEEKELEGLENDLKSAADEAAYANRSVSELSISALVLAGDLKKILPSSIKNAAEALAEGAKVIQKMNESVKSRRERYAQYFERDHAALAVVYTDTRHHAKNFVDKHGYDKVTEMTGKARSSLSDFRSAMQTDGQRNDAANFVNDVQKKLDDMERAVKEIWDEFVKEHLVEFFGVFGADIEGMLVGSARIDPHYRTILALDLHGLATRWMDDARKTFPVDVSALDDATKDLLQSELRKSIDDYVSTAENLCAETEPSNFETWIMGSARSLWDRIRG